MTSLVGKYGRVSQACGSWLGSERGDTLVNHFFGPSARNERPARSLSAIISCNHFNNRFSAPTHTKVVAPIVMRIGSGILYVGRIGSFTVGDASPSEVTVPVQEFFLFSEYPSISRRLFVVVGSNLGISQLCLVCFTCRGISTSAEYLITNRYCLRWPLNEVKFSHQQCFDSFRFWGPYVAIPS